MTRERDGNPLALRFNMSRMRRKDIALTVFLLAPIAIVVILVWLVVATLRDQRDDPRFRAPPRLGGERAPGP